MKPILIYVSLGLEQGWGGQGISVSCRDFLMQKCGISFDHIFNLWFILPPFAQNPTLELTLCP